MENEARPIIHIPKKLPNFAKGQVINASAYALAKLILEEKAKVPLQLPKAIAEINAFWRKIRVQKMWEPNNQRRYSVENSDLEHDAARLWQREELEVVARADALFFDAPMSKKHKGQLFCVQSIAWEVFESCKLGRKALPGITGESGLAAKYAIEVNGAGEVTGCGRESIVRAWRALKPIVPALAVCRPDVDREMQIALPYLIAESAFYFSQRSPFRAKKGSVYVPVQDQVLFLDDDKT